MRQAQTDKYNGVQNLWSIWREQQVSAFTIQKIPIPEIFLRKIPLKGLGHFLLTQKENLEKALPSLNHDPKIVSTLINNWNNDLNISEEHKTFIKLYLEKLYPGLNMKTLLQNIPKITNLLESMSSIFYSNPKSLIYLALDNLVKKIAIAMPLYA